MNTRESFLSEQKDVVLNTTFIRFQARGYLESNSSLPGFEILSVILSASVIPLIRSQKRKKDDESKSDPQNED